MGDFSSSTLLGQTTLANLSSTLTRSVAEGPQIVRGRKLGKLSEQHQHLRKDPGMLVNFLSVSKCYVTEDYQCYWCLFWHVHKM